MVAASPISSCWSSSLPAAGAAMALLCRRKPCKQARIAWFILLQLDLGAGSLCSQYLLSAFPRVSYPWHVVSPLLVQMNRGHGYSITLSFFEPLIKDKLWHLKLQGGFDDLVAGYLLSGSEAGGEQESTNI